MSDEKWYVIVVGIAVTAVILTLIAWGWSAGNTNAQKDKELRGRAIQACTRAAPDDVADCIDDARRAQSQ